MTAETRERTQASAKPMSESSAPDLTPDQAGDVAQPIGRSPGSGSNGQQANQVTVAIPEPPAATNGQGQPIPRAETDAKSTAPAWHELRVFAELYADVQQTRIACANRAERGGLDPMVLASQLAGLKDSEHQLGLALVRCYRRVVPAPVREWQQATPGIGEHLLARLLGAVGDPRWATPYHWESPDGARVRASSEDVSPRRVLVADPPFERNVAKLWAYCGHGDPTRKRRKGMTAEDGAALGNPRAKMLTHLLAEASMKCVGTAANDGSKPIVLAQPADAQRAGSGAESPTKPACEPRPTRARSPYRDTYEQARERYADRDDWTLGHQHAAALRLVGKAILRDLWLAAGDHTALDAHSSLVPGGQTRSDTHSTRAAGEVPTPTT